jgi:hypothetical protein
LAAAVESMKIRTDGDDRIDTSEQRCGAQEAVDRLGPQLGSVGVDL